MNSSLPAKPVGETDLLDAAMCAWEHVLAELAERKISRGMIHLGGPKTRGPKGRPKVLRTSVHFEVHHNKWDAWRDRHGMAALRAHVSGLAVNVHEAYEIARTAEYDQPFDWDFVPAFMERGIDDDCELRADWRSVALAIGKEG